MAQLEKYMNTMDDRRINILNVNMSLDPARGGTVERTLQLSKALAETESVQCTILATDAGWKGHSPGYAPEVSIKILPTVAERFYLPRYPFTAIKELVQEADIIHLMGHWLILNVIVYYYARLYRKPYVVCPAGELTIYGRSKVLKKCFNFIIGRRIIRNASGHVAIAVNEIPEFAACGIKASVVTLIPNGINIQDFQARDDQGFRRRLNLGERPFILFIGRLNDIKGPDLLLEAYCKLQKSFPVEHDLLVVGPDGGLLTQLKDSVMKHDMADRVHFVGFLGGEEKSQAYHASSFLVIPSRREAMSIVVLEGGLAGKAVLITDQCGFPELGEIGGGLVVPASVEGLSEGLRHMLEDPERLVAMGLKLQKNVCENYLWSSVVSRYLDLYKNVLEGTKT